MDLPSMNLAFDSKKYLASLNRLAPVVYVLGEYSGPIANGDLAAITHFMGELCPNPDVECVLRTHLNGVCKER